jgi:hypothetical protein
MDLARGRPAQPNECSGDAMDGLFSREGQLRRATTSTGPQQRGRPAGLVRPLLAGEALSHEL